VPQEAVSQDEIELRQFEQRRAALLVVPADARVADDDLALRKNPLSDSGISGLCGVQFDARDIEFAGLVAPDLEPGPVEDERIESRRADQGGNPPEGRIDGGQGQRRSAVVIENGHVGEKKLGAQPLPVCVDRADGDALAQRAGGVLLDVAPVFRDLRKDPVAKRKNSPGEQQIGDK